MEYYFSKTLNVSFDEAIKITTEALKSEGFGVISEIRMHEKLKEKLDIDFLDFVIIGLCPVIVEITSVASSNIFESSLALPIPILRTIFSILGTAILFL